MSERVRVYLGSRKGYRWVEREPCRCGRCLECVNRQLSWLTLKIVWEGWREECRKQGLRGVVVARV